MMILYILRIHHFNSDLCKINSFGEQVYSEQQKCKGWTLVMTNVVVTMTRKDAFYGSDVDARH